MLATGSSTTAYGRMNAWRCWSARMLASSRRRGCPDAHYDVLALVKPQFELGRERIGKGGVVRGADDRREALIGVGRAALGLGAAGAGFHSSGLPGPKGNRETFLWLVDPEGGRGSCDESLLEQLAREVEP